MTIENGGEQPANDTVVTAGEDAALTPYTGEKVAAGENQEAEEGTETEADDDEELDIEGEKFRIPRKVREAIAKPFQQDYSRKTEEVAGQRKALDGERESFTKEREARQAHFKDAAKVVAFDDRIAEVDADLQKYSQLDWNNLRLQDPDLYEQHRINRDTLRDRKENIVNQRGAAARAWTQKEQEYADSANREHGERVSKATAEIAKHVEGWAPGNELDVKLLKYGNKFNLSDKDMGELAIRAPVLVKLLNEHRVFTEAAAKQKTQQTLEKQLETKPVTRVGGNGSGTTLRTTDASGDRLSTEEWVKRERERLRKKA